MLVVSRVALVGAHGQEGGSALDVQESNGGAARSSGESSGKVRCAVVAAAVGMVVVGWSDGCVTYSPLTSSASSDALYLGGGISALVCGAVSMAGGGSGGGEEDLYVAFAAIDSGAVLAFHLPR